MSSILLFLKFFIFEGIMPLNFCYLIYALLRAVAVFLSDTFIDISRSENDNIDSFTHVLLSTDCR